MAQAPTPIPPPVSDAVKAAAKLRLLRAQQQLRILLLQAALIGIVASLIK